MAEQRTTQKNAEPVQDVSSPRVHPAGRLVVPGEKEKAAPPAVPVQTGQDTAPETRESRPEGAEGHDDKPEEKATEEERAALEAVYRQGRQRQRRKLLHDCEGLLLLDFDTLAMPNWPNHYALATARRKRDTWLLMLGILVVLVFAGMTAMVPAIIGGVSFGLLVLVAALGFPPVRHLFTDELSHAELLLKRHWMLHHARRHIEQLEGRLGLAWCCRPLADYNDALRRTRFQGLYHLSQHGRVPSAIKTRAHAQLYLMFALEAEKAYNRLRDAYLNDYQEQIDRGEAEPLNAASGATADTGEIPLEETDTPAVSASYAGAESAAPEESQVKSPSS